MARNRRSEFQRPSTKSLYGLIHLPTRSAKRAPKMAQPAFSLKQGLYDPKYEHDSHPRNGIRTSSSGVASASTSLSARRIGKVCRSGIERQSWRDYGWHGSDAV